MAHASAITRSRAEDAHKFREPAVRGAHLLAVSGFALAQPLFDLLGKNVEFFAVRGSRPGDIVLFAVVVTFVPALILLAVEIVVELVTRRDAAVLHYAFVGFLGAVFAVQALLHRAPGLAARDGLRRIVPEWIRDRRHRARCFAGCDRRLAGAASRDQCRAEHRGGSSQSEVARRK